MERMPDFLDSTHLMEKGPTLAERLARDGYLFLRGLLPRKTVLEVHRRLLEKAAAGGWLDPAHPVDDGVADPTAACKDPEERYMKVFRGIWADEALHRLRTHPNALALFERIFGEKALAHPMFVQAQHLSPQRQLRFHHRRPSGPSPHRWRNQLRDVGYRWAIARGRRGALAVAAGSHRAGVLGHQGRGRRRRHGHQRADPRRMGHRFLRGRAMRSSSRTPPCTVRLPNRSAARSASPSTPATSPRASRSPRSTCSPYSGCGSWEEVYAGWFSEDDKYYWRALSPRCRAFRPALLREARPDGLRHGRRGRPDVS